MEQEIADIFLALCELCNRYSIDLTTAFSTKLELTKRNTLQKKHAVGAINITPMAQIRISSIYNFPLLSHFTESSLEILQQVN